MSPLSYAPLRADAAAAADDDVSTSAPEMLTVSTVAATAVGVGHHLLKVEGYSRLKRTHGDNGSYLESAEFGAGGHTWRIKCFLNGARAEDAGYVSVFVERAGAAAGSVVHAEYEIEVVHHHGTVLRWEWCDGNPGNVYPLPFRKSNSWGIPQLISTKDLERSRFLKNDCFAVRCTVTVVEGRGAAEEVEVKAEDMERMGLACPCKDDSCKLHHARPRPDTTLGEAFARFCRSICG